MLLPTPAWTSGQVAWTGPQPEPRQASVTAPGCCPPARPAGGLSVCGVPLQASASCVQPLRPLSPPSPNTCIYSKCPHRVFPDLQWAQAGAAAAIAGVCVPGSELDPCLTCLCDRQALPSRAAPDQPLGHWHQRHSRHQTALQSPRVGCPQAPQRVVTDPGARAVG
uniref:Uncharacterized protein n=1 Tax=Pipistrellus kuhlii TaxID=59472 RepID=A0A7J7T1T1_PIPKU|nr:hypothetical protein mPipKuh1_009737 [Pipistrellus kuhlii]